MYYYIYTKVVQCSDGSLSCAELRLARVMVRATPRGHWRFEGSSRSPPTVLLRVLLLVYSASSSPVPDEICEEPRAVIANRK